MATWGQVVALSDDEPVVKEENKRKLGPRTQPSKGGRKKRLSLLAAQHAKFSVKSLRYKLESTCGCKCDCFRPFRKTTLFDRLVHLREKLASLPKLQSDEFVRVSFTAMFIKPTNQWGVNGFCCQPLKVFNLLRDQEEESYRGSRHLRLLQEPICNRGFLRALGLGKLRFHRLHQAARNRALLDCPADARFVPKGREGTEKQAIVVEFLEGLYKSAAESLPDCPSKSTSNKRPRQAPHERDDPKLDRSSIRHLPPGSIVDYLRLLRADYPHLKLSQKLFSKVWGEHFSHKLRIRGSAHHSKCSTCIRHRLIIRRVGTGPGRAAQLRELQKHLKLQYADRATYWADRSRSRLAAGSPSCSEVTAILDSFDQAKHAFPRSEAMSAKDFNSWARPKMSATTLILHGDGVVHALSPPHIPGNSSRTIEILSAGMTRCVQNGVDWRHCALHLQSDNCAKECKNQSVLRFLATMVATHRLKSARLSCLMSGHSHEDVDGLFSVMSTFISGHKELWTMDSFLNCYRKFFSSADVRPHEKCFRDVNILTSFHDWTFGSQMF